MATVRITDNLIREVGDKVDALFHKRLVDKKNEVEENTELAYRVFRLFVSETETQAANTLGSSWLNASNAFAAHIVMDTKKYAFGFKLSNHYLVPPRLANAYSHDQNRIRNNDQPYEEIAKVARELDTLTAECEALKTGLRNTMRMCATLKQLLEVWPTAIDFMSDTVKARHAFKHEKPTARVEAAKVIMTDDIQLKLIKARMMKT